MAIEVCYYDKLSKENDSSIEPTITKLPSCKCIRVDPIIDFVEFLDKNQQVIMGIKRKFLVYYKVYDEED